MFRTFHTETCLEKTKQLISPFRPLRPPELGPAPSPQLLEERALHSRAGGLGHSVCWTPQGPPASGASRAHGRWSRSEGAVPRGKHAASPFPHRSTLLTFRAPPQDLSLSLSLWTALARGRSILVPRPLHISKSPPSVTGPLLSAASRRAPPCPTPSSQPCDRS